MITVKMIESNYYKLLVINDIQKYLIVLIMYCSEIVKSYEIEEDARNCSDLYKLEEIISNLLKVRSVIVINVSCFIDNIYVTNNSRTLYYANRHLIKYICNNLGVNYLEVKVDTNKIMSKYYKPRSVKVMLYHNVEHNCSQQYILFNNIEFFNILINKV